jgi:hypothetical protein
MDIPIPPVLKSGERIHYPIFHDECCIHANDHSTFIWAREGEPPLRNKSRGRIVHVLDFIIEHCGRLVLWQFEQDAQKRLPKAPLRPTPVLPIATPAAQAAPSAMAAPKKAVPKKKAAAKNVPATRCTLEHADTWVPPPPPAPFTSYQIPSFDARRIIYPGANYDPWWDMPQLIAQVQ